MPDSLYSKVEKFYAVNPDQPVYMSALQRAAFVTEALEWIDGLWQSDELQDHLTYEEYIEFRESIKESVSLY
jgi:hypothetical protein